MSEEVVIKEATPDHMGFIYSTWLDSFHRDTTFGKMSLNRMFMDFYRDVTQYIVDKPNTKILIVTLKDEPLLVLSYLVFEPGILHYVYTKFPFRKHGFARKLVEHAFPERPISFTHQTIAVKDIVLMHRRALSYDSSLIFKGDNNSAKTEEKRKAS